MGLTILKTIQTTAYEGNLDVVKTFIEKEKTVNEFDDKSLINAVNMNSEPVRNRDARIFLPSSENLNFEIFTNAFNKSASAKRSDSLLKGDHKLAEVNNDVYALQCLIYYGGSLPLGNTDINCVDKKNFIDDVEFFDWNGVFDYGCKYLMTHVKDKNGELYNLLSNVDIKFNAVKKFLNEDDDLKKHLKGDGLKKHLKDGSVEYSDIEYEYVGVN
jgi:hypothetical protein